MDVVEFIKKDAERKSHRSPNLIILFSVGVFLIPVAFGILMRDSYEGVFAPRIFIPNLAASILLFSTALMGMNKNFSGQKYFKWGVVILFLGSVLAIERIFFPDGPRTLYPTSSQFWHENMKCFTKGGITTVVLGIWMSLFAFAIASWPGRRWRALLSVEAGISGVIMLGFHCDSSSVGHVLIAHLGQGLVLGLLVFLGQEFFFYAGLKNSFPDLKARIKNFYRLG